MYQTKFFQGSDNTELVQLIMTIFKTSHDGLAICDRNGYVLLYNDAYLSITGIPADILNNFSYIEQKEMHMVPDSSAARAIATKQTHSVVIHYANGRTAINTATPLLDPKQGAAVCRRQRPRYYRAEQATAGAGGNAPDQFFVPTRARADPKRHRLGRPDHLPQQHDAPDRLAGESLCG